MKEKPSLLKPITTHEVPSKISTGSGSMDNLVTLNRLLLSPFRNNAQAASVCAALAIIEAAEKGEVIPPASFEREGENKFNWSEFRAFYCIIKSVLQYSFRFADRRSNKMIKRRELSPVYLLFIPINLFESWITR